MKLSRLRPWLGRGAKWLGVALLLCVLAIVVDGWQAFGKAAEGSRRARMEQSPQWRDGQFHNPQPLFNDAWGMFAAMSHASGHITPATAPPSVTLDPQLLKQAPASGLRVTWFGHSSILIEIDGQRVLTDPMWGERASPVSWLGPKRWYPPAIALADLPPVDVVVISHDHYDHLDYSTIRAIKDWPTKFVVPLGIGAHLEYWGVSPMQIVELDWWEHTQVGGLAVVCTPARHASGRVLFDNDAKLWAGWAFLGSKHRAYFSGDTGLFPGMKEIGERLGPFDVTMIETGQYHRSWPDWHIGPEQAVEAHQLVRGRVMLPVHWALLGLAFHGWTEPVERSVAEAERRQQTLLTPRPGESVEPTGPLKLARWWPEVAWETAQEHPIVSTQLQ